VQLLKYNKVPIKSTDITVVGASLVVGKPLSMMLLNEFATVSICHIFTKDTAAISCKSDVVISAAGKAKLIQTQHLKEGAIVVDVGINALPDGKICGDVDYDGVFDKVKAITPVPGGVGSITTSILASHVVKACKLQNNL
jgi:methylenetetrahydrofolate dehydrogenase (NADP+)/methenyltetrahydrofolate cyclohydrolase